MPEAKVGTKRNTQTMKNELCRNISPWGVERGSCGVCAQRDAGRACVFADQNVCHLSATLLRKHVRSMCDPPTILVRSACFLRDPDEVHPNFYKRSCASTYLFYNTKREVALLGAVFTFVSARVLKTYLRLRRGKLGAVFTFVSARVLKTYLRLRRGISRILPWLLFCMAAALDSAIVHSPPKWSNAN